MLKLKSIKKDYMAGDSVVHALKGIDLEFRENEFVAILGHSGCGKTTLLNIIGGLDQYTSGDMIINGKSTKNGKADTDTTPFDGLDALCTGPSTEYKPTAAVDLSSVDAIKANAEAFTFQIDTWLATLSQKPDALLCNSKTATALKYIAKIMGYYTQSKDDFGKGVDAYDGIPIVDMGRYYDGASSKTVDEVGTDAKTVTTAIYAVCFGLDALHAVSPKGGKIINTYLPDLSKPGAVKKGEVEMVAGIVLKDSTKAGVFRNIKVAATA